MMEKLLRKLLLSNNYDVDKDEFNYYFQTHPDHPNLIAIENTLNYFKIENVVLQIENEDFESLPNVFITSLKAVPHDLVLASKKDGVLIILDKLNKSFKIKTDDFLMKWTGIVVAIEENEKLPHANLNTKLNRYNFKLSLNFILLGISTLILGYALWKFSFSEIIYATVSLIGLYYCFEIFQNQQGKQSVILNKICNEPQKDKGSCQKIIESDKINIGGLKLADMALYYFLTTVIFSLFIKNTQFLILSLSILSVPVIVYSLYIQLIKEKKLCKICISVVLILLSQIIVSFVYFNFHFSFDSLFNSLIYFFTTFPLYIFIQGTLKANEKLKIENITNLRFKRDYDHFKAELVATTPKTFNHKDCFFIGNKNAKIHISLISNLECKFCAEAHEILRKLQYSEDVSFQIRFNIADGEIHENIESIFKILLHSYSTEEQFFLNVLDSWYKNMSYKGFLKEYNALKQDYNLNSITEVTKENISNDLNFTPVFLINGYLYPQKYERGDILYFIQALIEDEEI